MTASDGYDWLYPRELGSGNETPPLAGGEIDAVYQTVDGGTAFGVTGPDGTPMVYVDATYGQPPQDAYGRQIPQPDSEPKGDPSSYFSVWELSDGTVHVAGVRGPGSKADFGAALHALEGKPRPAQLPPASQYDYPPRRGHPVVAGEAYPLFADEVPYPTTSAAMARQAMRPYDTAREAATTPARTESSASSRKQTLKILLAVAALPLYSGILSASYNSLNGDAPTETSLMNPGDTFSHAWDQYKRIIPGI